MLSQAYDRLVTPERLVTSGPYKYVQHPIYTSYMLLFMGYCLLLHSAPAAACITAACLLYYRARTSVERHILSSTFGDRYEEYRSRTKSLFLPGVL